MFRLVTKRVTAQDEWRQVCHLCWWEMAWCQVSRGQKGQEEEGQSHVVLLCKQSTSGISWMLTINLKTIVSGYTYLPGSSCIVSQATPIWTVLPGRSCIISGTPIWMVLPGHSCIISGYTYLDGPARTLMHCISVWTVLPGSSCIVSQSGRSCQEAHALYLSLDGPARKLMHCISVWTVLPESSCTTLDNPPYFVANLTLCSQTDHHQVHIHLHSHLSRPRSLRSEDYLPPRSLT